MQQQHNWTELNFTKEYVYNPKHLMKTNMSIVYYAKHVKTSKIVILKEMERLENNTRPNIARNKEIDREISVMKAASISGNNYLSKLLHCEDTGNRVYLIIEYYENGSLNNYLSKKPGKKLPEQPALEIFRKILKGYDWFYKNNIVHRDLKLENIFMDGEDPKIGDFGSSRRLDETQVMIEDPNNYSKLKSFSGFNRAPEQILGDDYGSPVDVWGLGLILYEMIYGTHPFEGDYDLQTETNILEKQPNYSKEFKTTPLLQAILEKNPMKRISWTELLNHPLIKISEQTTLPQSDQKAQPKIDLKPQTQVDTKAQIEEVTTPSMKKKSKIVILSDETLLENPQIDPDTEKKLMLYLNYGKLFSLCVTVLNKCAKLVAEKVSRNFLNFPNFLALAYGFTKLAIIKLRLARFLQSGCGSTKATEIEALKKRMEGFFYSEDFRALVLRVTNDRFVDMTIRTKILTVLTSNAEESAAYEAEFKKWIGEQEKVLFQALNAFSEPLGELVGPGYQLFSFITEFLDSEPEDLSSGAVIQLMTVINDDLKKIEETQKKPTPTQTKSNANRIVILSKSSGGL